MKIKMLGNNCDCWKQGDIFEVCKNEKGFLYITCNDVENGSEHYLLDHKWEDITDISDLADYYEVINE